MKKHKKYNRILELLKYAFGWNTREITEMQAELINDTIIATDKALTLNRVIGSYSKEQLKKAWNDGIEAEQQRCGEFNIDNY